MSGTVKPKIFFIGETKVRHGEVQNLLEHLGVPDWTSDAASDGELLTEIYGRGCYMSFASETVNPSEVNPNLTTVRKTNKSYLTNVIKKGDGSIFEHVMTNWFFADVSRVFTHELVRHRIGVAISQESLRFVRLTDLNWFAPAAIKEDADLMTIYSDSFEWLSELQRFLADKMSLDSGKKFDELKKLTSTARRLAPMGLATNIGWSANLRTLRHVIEQRTAPWAEEEIRLVFNEVAEIAAAQWPVVFNDYDVEIVDGIGWWKTANNKL